MIGKIILGVLILVIEFIIWCMLKVGDKDER